MQSGRLAWHESQFHGRLTGHPRKFITLRSILVCLCMQALSVHAQDVARDHILYQSPQLKITPHDGQSLANWCGLERKNKPHEELRTLALYDVKHTERYPLFAPDFETFVQQNIIPAIEKACEGMPGFRANYEINLAMQNSQERYPADRFFFRYRDGNLVRRQYVPGPLATAVFSESQIAAFTPPKQLDRVETELATVGPMAFYSHTDPLCYGFIAHLDAEFSTTAEQRDAWIDANYDDPPPPGRRAARQRNRNQADKRNSGFAGFVEQAVLPVLKSNNCQRSMAVTIYFYEPGAVEPWDTMRYELYPTKLVSHDMSKKAMDLAVLKVNERVLGTCNGSRYCNMLGGVYLDAIYRNDTLTLNRLNEELREEYASQPSISQYKKFISIMADAGVAGANAQDTELKFLMLLAGKYMYDYSRFAKRPPRTLEGKTQSCWDVGAERVDTRVTTRVIDYEDQHGNYQGSAGGFEVGKVYQVNPGFLSLCNRICGAGSGEMGDLLGGWFELKKAGLILAGVEQSIKSMECRGEDVRQFEANLIRLTKQSLNMP